jgi:predicted enzyme involved in methoxymalonyl-ACP biosynthesis
MNIKDKYGDYGLVGAAILMRQNRTCVIDTLLMSCRVLGRGAEEALIAKITEAAKMLDCDELSGKYIPTPKNPMVRDLYSRFNFSRVGQQDEWILDIRTQFFDQITTKATEQVMLFENPVGDHDAHLLPRSSGERRAR